MKFISFFTYRPISTFMVFSILTLLGIISFLRMSVDLRPGSDSSVLTIFIGIRGGLPPEDIESLVTKKVEDEMAPLPNLEDILSVSRKERAVITLAFKPGIDSSRAALEVQERLAKIRGNLPKDIEKPVVSRYDENQSPIIILAISSDHFSPEELREIADQQIKPVLKRIHGVANVEVGGGRERKILVEFDKNRIEAYSIPMRQIISKIGSDNLNLLTGKMEKRRESYYVRTVGAFKTLKDIENLPIAVTKEGSRILLKNVAEVKDFYLEPQSYSRLNQQPVVSAYVQKEASSNTIEVAEEVKMARLQLIKELDPRIELSIVSDQSIEIKGALLDVRKSLIFGAILAGLILLFFLRDLLTSSFIFISIPLSLILTLTIMHFYGLSLNVMTISGLVIATGMVVDSSIVVLENIISHRNKLIHLRNRQQESSENERQAEEAWRDLPVRATGEMLLALTASTLTSVIVFLPIVFLNPQVRILYMGLSITVTFALLFSLLVSVTVIPSLSANTSQKWTKESSYFSVTFWLYIQNGFNRLIPKLNRTIYRIRNFIGRIFKRKKKQHDTVYSLNSRPTFYKFRKGFRGYRHWVSLFMRRRYWVSACLAVVLLGCIVLYKFVDKEFVGSSEENEFIIFVELPSGTKLAVSDQVVEDVEKLINETPEVQKSVKTSVARVEGWSSKIYVTLEPRRERQRSTQEVISFLRPLVSQIGQQFDAFIYFSEPISSKEFLIDVFGYNYNKLRDIAINIAKNLEKVSGLADIKLRYKPGRPEVRIEMDREKAIMFNLTVQDVSESLHAQIRGLRATYFLTPTAQVETVARLQERFRKTLEDVEYLTIVNSKGIIVPVRQFSNFEFGLTPSEIWRKDRERMIQVSANRGEIALSKVGLQVRDALKGMEVPTGYYYEFGGDYPKMLETEKESRFAFIIMILLIYTVLASLFESYLQPLVILIAVPLTLIGSIPMLYLTKTPVTVVALIGFIMLGGIAVGNSIILVDVFNRLHKEKNRLRALLQAGQERIRPIVMTTLTTIFGLVPFLLNPLWKPLAITVIGGITVSTFLVLFILPGFYLVLIDVHGRIRNSIYKIFKVQT